MILLVIFIVFMLFQSEAAFSFDGYTGIKYSIIILNNLVPFFIIIFFLSKEKGCT